MRLYSLCFIIHLLAAEIINSEQIQIHGTTTKTLCDTKDAEQAIKDLHDDLDDDDDGTISTTGKFVDVLQKSAAVTFDVPVNIITAEYLEIFKYHCDVVFRK